MAKLLEFLDRHTARNLFRSSHLKQLHLAKEIYAISPDSSLFRYLLSNCDLFVGLEISIAI